MIRKDEFNCIDLVCWLEVLKDMVFPAKSVKCIMTSCKYLCWKISASMVGDVDVIMTTELANPIMTIKKTNVAEN